MGLRMSLVIQMVMLASGRCSDLLIHPSRWTSRSFQTTELEPNWICLGKVPPVHAGIDEDLPHPFIPRTKGRHIPIGPPPLNERRYLRKDAAEQLWMSLQT